MRRSILLLALPYLAILVCAGIAGRELAATPSPRFSSADPAVVVRFHRHYDPYFRHLFGCPATATDPAECRPGAGWIDTSEWRQARELAKSVFELREP